MSFSEVFADCEPEHNRLGGYCSGLGWRVDRGFNDRGFVWSITDDNGDFIVCHSPSPSVNVTSIGTHAIHEEVRKMSAIFLSV